jgi:hypothetical protein
MTWAHVRGLSYMAVTAGLFGYWQRNVVAGLFMMAFLLFLEKLFRYLATVIATVASVAEEAPDERDPILEGLEKDNSPGAADRLNDYLIDKWKAEKGR